MKKLFLPLLTIALLISGCSATSSEASIMSTEQYAMNTVSQEYSSPDYYLPFTKGKSNEITMQIGKTRTAKNMISQGTPEFKENCFFDQCAKLDGKDDSFEPPDVKVFEKGNQFTFSGWVNTLPSEKYPSEHYVIWQGKGGARPDTPRPEMYLSILQQNAGSGNLKWVWDKGSEGKKEISTPISLNAWHHVAFTLASDKKVSLYLDGAAVGNAMIDDGFLTSRREWNMGVRIGRRGVTGSSSTGEPFPKYFYSGYLDEMKIYEQALAQAEMTKLAALPQSTNTAHPTAAKKVPSKTARTKIVTKQPSVPKTVTIKITNAGFDTPIRVKKGDTVKWVNESDVPHTVKGKFVPGGESEALYKGDTYLLKPGQIGAFFYTCGLHPSMKGTIRVEKP